MTYHVVCRTCATEGASGPHEAIKDNEDEAKRARDIHRQSHPDHDVRIAEVDG